MDDKIIGKAEHFFGVVGEAQQLINNKDHKGVLELFKSILSASEIKTNHPFREDIITYCRSSIKVGIHNILFFSDSNNSNQWIAIQICNLIDIIRVNNTYYKVADNCSDNCINKLSKKLDTDQKLLSQYSRRDPFWGIRISHQRPYHFFYDQYINLFQLSKCLQNAEKGITTDKDCFYPIELFGKKIIREYSDNAIFMLPTTISAWHRSDLLKEAVTMENAINMDIEKSSITFDQYDFVLWIGITGQKRSWIEQIDGYFQIVSRLSIALKTLVIIDGMTATHGDVLTNNEDHEVAEKLIKKITPFADCVNIVGKDYKTKISYCKKIDAFIANAGTGSMVPLRFCKKPGVLHSNTKLFTFRGEYPEHVKKVNNAYIVDEKSEGIGGDRISYHIDWQAVYNQLITIIKTKKNLDLPNAFFPSNCFYKNKSLNLFKNLSKSINSNSQSADILRDVALTFEKTGDYRTAFSLMKEAKTLRPNGQFISKKLKELSTLVNH